MTDEAGNQQKSIASTAIFGILGAGLVYYGHRTKPSLLATLATTAGYSLITKAVSSTIFAALAP
jgi:hypothetical protein